MIGLVTGHSFTGWTQQQDLNKAIAKLKEQAAKMGANGVLVDSITGPRDSSGALVLRSERSKRIDSADVAVLGSQTDR